jgi:hypothetical protein
MLQSWMLERIASEGREVTHMVCDGQAQGQQAGVGRQVIAQKIAAQGSEQRGGQGDRRAGGGSILAGILDQELEGDYRREEAGGGLQQGGSRHGRREAAGIQPGNVAKREGVVRRIAP